MAIIGMQHSAIKNQPFHLLPFEAPGSCCIASILLTTWLGPCRAPAQTIVQRAIAAESGNDEVDTQRYEGSISDAPTQCAVVE
jgi:hypothetical protein